MRRFSIPLLVLLVGCATSPTGDDGADDEGDGKADGAITARGSYLRRERFNAMTTGAAPTGVQLHPAGSGCANTASWAGTGCRLAARCARSARTDSTCVGRVPGGTNPM
jgi:hypothetical protein